MPEGAGHDGSEGRDKMTTVGETKEHSDPAREDGETTEGIANTMKMLFPQVDQPQTNGTEPC
ncbi:hypothetical protein K505DRAFT_322148 [Melanomma pulvis-pyrius CBS 109.77]|uniref:Uncharacterized protein n=1 Tax=Melanomma pulvis-pyrius CBS 109.77 TaxID=1314802 RepID=A0A6A6XPG1_9PLEO|nr:hypothetical protein K505DRAFT_322148 [Melanomma pulvis-pyrius CBS 109.77]